MLSTLSTSHTVQRISVMWLKWRYLDCVRITKLPVCCREEHTKENLTPETQLAQTKETLW